MNVLNLISNQNTSTISFIIQSNHTFLYLNGLSVRQVKRITVERLSLPQLVKEWRYKMNELKIFENAEFGQIRTVIIDNEPWLVGKDVAEVLGYSNTRDTLANHIEEEDKNTVVIYDGKRGNPNQIVINESGLYSLILSSKLPNAKKFKHWVTSEVLPSIRKTGSYHLPSTYKEALIQLVAQVEENERLQLENNELKPKAEFSAISEAVAILIRQL